MIAYSPKIVSSDVFRYDNKKMKSEIFGPANLEQTDMESIF